MTTLPRSETVLIRREHLMTLLTCAEAHAQFLDPEDDRPHEDVLIDAGLYEDRDFTEAERAAGDDVSPDGEVYEMRFCPSPMLEQAREAAEVALGLVDQADFPAAPAEPEAAAT